jgi:hypothetical protein
MRAVTSMTRDRNSDYVWSERQIVSYLRYIEDDFGPNPVFEEIE